jgi:hypothetical protein
MLWLPALFRVSVCVWLMPSATVPKLKLVGFALKLPAATAVAESAMLKGLFDPSLVNDKVPVAPPADVGLKTIFTFVLCPAANVTGKARPFMAKPAPLTAACEIVRLVLPVLLRMSTCDWLVPTWTFPKATLAGAAVKSPDAAGCEFCALDLPELKPWQPTIADSASADIASRAARKLQWAGEWSIENRLSVLYNS